MTSGSAENGLGPVGTAAAGSAGEIAPARPRLRLVTRDEEEIGPISPETVLVCPGLREAALRAEPDTPRWAASAAASPDQEKDGGASETGDEPELGPAAYDTPDLRLRRHGLTLERWVSCESSRWRLELPRGEVVDAPGEGPGGGVPARIARLVRAVAGGQELEAMPRQCDHPDFAHLQDMVWAQRHAMLAHDPGVRLGTDPENLHQFRVATRRLRAFVRVARTLVAKEWAAALRTELAESGRFTGPVRDLDVLLEHLSGEVELLDDAEWPAGNALIAELQRERGARRQELARWLEDPRYFALLDRLRLPVRAARRPRGSLALLAAR